MNTTKASQAPALKLWGHVQVLYNLVGINISSVNVKLSERNIQFFNIGEDRNLVCAIILWFFFK